MFVRNPIKLRVQTRRLQDLDQERVNYNLWAKSTHPPVFINQVVLEHGHAHLLTRCSWPRSCCNTELNACYRIHMAQKAPQAVYCLALYRRIWLPPVQEHQEVLYVVDAW